MNAILRRAFAPIHTERAQHVERGLPVDSFPMNRPPLLECRLQNLRLPAYGEAYVFLPSQQYT